MTTELQTFQFDGIPVSVVDQDGEGWMIGEDIGKALGYSEPRKSINNLFDRYREELEEYSVDIKLMATDGKQYDTRVYNEEGVMMIGFLSKQPKAVAFRKWAVKILKAYRHKDLVQENTLYLAEIKSHLDTQRLLITSLQSNLAFTQDTVDKQISQGLADMAAKLAEVEKTAQERITQAARNEWVAKNDLAATQSQLDDRNKEFDLVFQALTPIKAEEAKTILHWLYVRNMTTREVANFFYRSPGQICKVRKERYTRWASVMDASWETGHAH
jgi:prophage antirepressor-like protein